MWEKLWLLVLSWLFKNGERIMGTEKICPLLTMGYLANQYAKIGLDHGKVTSLGHVYCLKEKCQLWDPDFGCRLINWMSK